MVGEDPLQNSGGPFCPSCGVRNDLGANYCAGCGAALSPGGDAPYQLGPTQEVHLEFVGTGLQALGWGLWAMFLGILIIPYAWGVAVLARWYVRNLSFSDGTKTHFSGTGGQIWWLGLLIILSLVLNFIPLVGGINFLFGSYWIFLLILRWFFDHLVLSTGESLTFEGGYWPYLGYSLLLAISIYSIIGWAWVATAFMRWFCRNISVPDQQVVFVGKGWDTLWRGFVAILGSLLIITIPWLWVWYLRWIMRNVIWMRPAA